jgi:hypothetical protein
MYTQLNFIRTPIAINDPNIIKPGAVINTGPNGKYTIGRFVTGLNDINDKQCSSGSPCNFTGIVNKEKWFHINYIFEIINYHCRHCLKNCYRKNPDDNGNRVPSKAVENQSCCFRPP